MVAIYVALASMSLGLGTPAEPGPGFFPIGGALLLGASAAIHLVGAPRRAQAPVEADAKTRWQNIAYVLGAVVAYALLLDTLGFVACTFLMFIFFLQVVSSQPWPKSLAVALAASAGAFILFDLVLSAQLPKGPLGF